MILIQTILTQRCTGPDARPRPAEGFILFVYIPASLTIPRSLPCLTSSRRPRGQSKADVFVDKAGFTMGGAYLGICFACFLHAARAI